MSKSEEILRPSDFINDPENCLFDELGTISRLIRKKSQTPNNCWAAGCAICAHSAI